MYYTYIVLHWHIYLCAYLSGCHTMRAFNCNDTDNGNVNKRISFIAWYTPTFAYVYNIYIYTHVHIRAGIRILIHRQNFKLYCFYCSDSPSAGGLCCQVLPQVIVIIHRSSPMLHIYIYEEYVYVEYACMYILKVKFVVICTHLNEQTPNSINALPSFRFPDAASALVRSIFPGDRWPPY